MKISTQSIRTVGLPFTLEASIQEDKHDIVVFSHLRWGFVTQRPQHLLLRLAKGRKILFVEEPIPYTDKNHSTFHSIQVNDQITVIQPRISWAALIEELSPVVMRAMQKNKIDVNPILWFYSPMFVGMTDKISCSTIVYDCMDELSAFVGAPPELIANERRLLSMADVVFTGGKSLFESKRKYHENVFCFPSSVDKKHFEKSTTLVGSLPKDIVKIKPPVVGFYGVIDERLNLSLIDEVSKLTPEVSFVLIGPVVKIDPTALPKRKNIFYLGQKNYAELPAYLKGFDIAMMPFALNDATKFISPTKTLEFMAAKKPIISTPITDVVRDYSNEVKIDEDAQSFRRAIVRYLSETQSEKKQREQLQAAVIDRTSWDKTVDEMEEILSRPLVSFKPTLSPGYSYSV